jgi:hypothetical protein
MAVADHTGQAWFQGFNDVGVAVFNMNATELVEIKVRSFFSMTILQLCSSHANQGAR